MNEEIISLYSAEGVEMKFEKVASADLAGKSYVVLAPVEMLPGMKDCQAFVFELSREGDDARLNIVSDPDLIEAVFQVYAAQMLQKTEEQARRSLF